MLKITDTYKAIESLFGDSGFDFAKWEIYAESLIGGLPELLKDDLKFYLQDGYSFEGDFLPIINSVRGSRRAETVHEAFLAVTDGLAEKITRVFGKELDVEIVLYLGLCNAAGWVTRFGERDVILLGIEKILELGWCGVDDMYGLVYHELGHIFHRQYGSFDHPCDGEQKSFVWQLFREGFAMWFEQMLVGRAEYFHQDKNDWKIWCDEHFPQILVDFDRDLPTMTRENQRYFGDLVDYNGHGDVGYYLGARFVRRLSEKYSVDELVNLTPDDVWKLYTDFADEIKH